MKFVCQYIVMVLKRSLWISMCFLLSIHQSFSLPNHFGKMLIDMGHLHAGDIILSDNWNYTLSANDYGSFTTFISIKNYVQISSINSNFFIMYHPAFVSE